MSNSFRKVKHAFVLISLSAFATVAVAAQPWRRLRFDGIGPAKVGMSLSQLNVALGEKFALPKDKDEQTCFYVNPSGDRGVNFMILEGKLARIDVYDRRVASEAGILVGDTEKKVLAEYGKRVKVDPHKYSDTGHYLTVHSKDAKYGIRYETETGKITSFYAGTAEAIQFVEGCQ